MNVLDLFSGIGGFSLGLERAGMTTVAFCEKDAFCQKVLRKHWPDVPIHSDIKELEGEQFRGTDVVVGGFPCQPYSVAGKRTGADDDRALWPEMFRVIREVQPAWVIGENVAGFEHMGLAGCVSDLEGDGFAVQVFDIPACGVGAIHRRHRLWIVAHANGDSEPRKPKHGNKGQGKLGVAAHANANGTHKRGGWGNLYHELRDGETPECERDELKFRFDGNDSHVAHANGSFSEGNGSALGSKQERTEHGVGIRWPTEPSVCRADDGVPNRVDRLRALGNAVVPQVVEVIGRAIMRTENGRF